MSVLRQQFAQDIAVTVIDATTEVVDLFGPISPLATPYAENTDHVTEPRQTRQNESGWVVVDGWDGSALDVATVTLDVEIWSQASRASQRNVEAALFPSGATAPTDPMLKRVVATGLLGNSATVLAVFGGGLGGNDVKDIPALHLRADEFVRLSITNASGGDLGPVTLSAKYDLGGNPGDTHRLA